MEAQRYPDDFDGIVAGAPAADFTGIGAQFIKDVRAQFPDPKNLTPLLPPETMKSVEAQILEKCDALDGVKDGVMEDPRQCKVDVATLTGLSDAQHAALKTIYAPRRAGSDDVISRRSRSAAKASWPAGRRGSPASAPRAGQPPQAPSLRYALRHRSCSSTSSSTIPTGTTRRYDLSTWKKDTAQTASFLNATNPNLDAFKAKGHKLLLWHGWSDAGLTPLGTIKYYDEVHGARSEGRDYVRMFMMPGVLHCAGGPGPTTSTGRRRSTAGSRAARRRSGSSRRRATGGDGHAHASALRRIRSTRSTTAPAAPIRPRTSCASDSRVTTRSCEVRLGGGMLVVACSRCGGVPTRRLASALTRSFDAATDAWERGDYAPALNGYHPRAERAGRRCVLRTDRADDRRAVRDARADGRRPRAAVQPATTSSSSTKPGSRRRAARASCATTPALTPVADLPGVSATFSSTLQPGRVSARFPTTTRSAARRRRSSRPR